MIGLQITFKVFNKKKEDTAYHVTSCLFPIKIKMKQEIIDIPRGEFEERIEKAKKLFQLYNDVTFGNKVESVKSRIILRQIL